MEKFSLFRTIRGLVSGDKVRYQDDSYDIDLTYITDRVIAMAFPASGVESTYRNFIDSVANLLKEKHPDHFMIFNLSERDYDFSKFDHRVQNWCKFPDHNPPTVSLLIRIVISIHSWLLSDPLNVVVVHCLAGKGRTGTVISSYLMYCGLFNHARRAMEFFANRRSLNFWGVTGPAQVRYVEYIDTIFHRPKEKKPKLRPLHLRYIRFSEAPKMFLGPLKTGMMPVITVYSLSQGMKKLYCNVGANEEVRSYSSTYGQISFSMNCQIRGDILILAKHAFPLRSETMFRCNFHTGFVRPPCHCFLRDDLDGPQKDTRFSPDFTLEIGLEDIVPEDIQDVQLEAEIEEEERLWNSPLPEPRDGTTPFFSNDDEKELSLKVAKARGETTFLTKQGLAFSGKSDFLWKKGHKIKKWKRRWFVLKPNGTLVYFSKPQDMIPLGRVDIQHIWNISVQPKEKNPSMPNCIEILLARPEHWSHSTLEISCSTPTQRDEWIEAIEGARDVLINSSPSLNTPPEHICNNDEHCSPLNDNSCNLDLD